MLCKQGFKSLKNHNNCQAGISNPLAAPHHLDLHPWYRCHQVWDCQDPSQAQLDGAFGDCANGASGGVFTSQISEDLSTGWCETDEDKLNQFPAPDLPAKSTGEKNRVRLKRINLEKNRYSLYNICKFDIYFHMSFILK